MPYTVDWLLAGVESKSKVKFLFFWGHQKSKSGAVTAACFSQWWASSFTVEGVRYATTEHWMMAQKALLFANTGIYQQIIAARSPAEAKALGRQVRNFDEAVWNASRLAIVVRGNLEKFRQHPELQEFLLNTKDRVLVEASPVDSIWGIGLAADDARAENPRQWNGLNLLGFALMEVRDALRA
jgi:ribA/ribD-fused uncharacterized protein